MFTLKYLTKWIFYTVDDVNLGDQEELATKTMFNDKDLIAEAQDHKISMSEKH